MNINRVVLVVLTSILASCVGTTATSDHLPDSSTLAEGEGLAFGSFLVTVPGEVADREQQEMIDALHERELTATVRRFVRHGDPGGEFTWRDYQGDEFLVTWRADDEHSFVLRGPAGTYQILHIRDRHEGFLAKGWCELDSPGDFEVHAGEITYVGTLVLEATFRSEDQSKFVQLIERATREPAFPESSLDMNLSVVDAKDSTLRELDTHGAFADKEIRTELLNVGTRGWGFKAPPPPELPKAPPK